MKQTIYYAHCMKDYHTNTEKLHVKLLEQMGFKVINPSDKHHSDMVDKMKKAGSTGTQIMYKFVDIVKTCDHLAFSTTDDNKVSSGVALEIDAMKKKGGTVIQLPDLKNLSRMSIADTMKHLKS